MPTLKSTCFVCFIAYTVVHFAAGNVFAEIEDFEKSEVPANWKAIDGKIEITSERYKSGKQSLLWTWDKPGASLRYVNPKAFEGIVGLNREGASDNFAYWVYNEKPTPDVLRVDFSDGRRIVVRCWHYLNYRGWRSLGVPYAKVGWNSNTRIVSMIIRAPNSQGTSRLYIDYVNTRCFGKLSPDYQQPWVDNPQFLKTPEAFLLSTSDISQNRPWLPPLVPLKDMTPEQRESLKTMTARWHLGLDKGTQTLPEKQVTDLCKRVEAIVVRKNGILTGRPISGFNAPPNSFDFGATQQLREQFYSAIRSVNGAKDQRQANLLKQAYVDLCEYSLDQGDAEGSGSPGAFGYDTCQWPNAIFPMREVLEKAGIAHDYAASLAWHNGGAAVFQKTIGGFPEGDLDRVMLNYNSLPKALAMFPDPAVRFQRFMAFRRMIDTICARRDMNPMTADGLAYHHGMFHCDYASYEMPTLIHLCRTFQDTCFRLSPEAHETLKRYVAVMAFMCNRYDMPPNLPARAGTPRIFNMAEMAGIMAECGTPDGKQPLDRDMASLFLKLNQNTKDPRVAKYQALGIKPHPQVGHWSVNGVAGVLHRRDDWLVSIVGMNKYFFGTEIYDFTGCRYSHFTRYGSIYVVSSGNPPSCAASGYRFDGWDWRLWPGATTPLFPPQAIWHKQYGPSSSNTFGGGTALEGDGIWGCDMQIHDMNFNKSAFCFGNRITTITTNIKHPMKYNPTCVTTLYQNALPGQKDTEPCWVDGAEVRQFPAESKFDLKSPHWLIDNKRTGYYLYPGDAVVRVFRRPQSWIYMCPEYLKDPKNSPFQPRNNTWNAQGYFREKPLDANEKYFKPATGDFAVAYFDHGEKQPLCDCAYTMLIKTDAAAMRQFAEAMTNPESAPCAIFQKNAAAHIVADRETKTVGYILFAAGDVRAKGRLASASRPCAVMIREKPSNQIKLSVASTDLGNKLPIQILLRGRWSLVSSDAEKIVRVELQGNNTLIDIDYNARSGTNRYMPIRIVLEQN